MDMNKLLTEAKKELIKDGKILPKVIAISKDKDIIIIPIPFKSDAEKDIMREALKHTITLTGSQEYYCIQELWLSQQREGRIQTRARRDIDWKEAIAIMKFTPTSAESVLSIFTREGKKFVFDDQPMFKLGSINYWDVFNYNPSEINEMVNSHNQEVIKVLAKKLSDKFKKEFFNCKTKEGRKEVISKMIKEAKNMKKEQDKMQLEDTDEVAK